MAVLKLAYWLLDLRCPVLSLKELGYTATIGFVSGGSTRANSVIRSLRTVAFSIFGRTWLLTDAQLESKAANRHRYSSRATV